MHCNYHIMYVFIKNKKKIVNKNIREQDLKQFNVTQKQ